MEGRRQAPAATVVNANAGARKHGARSHTLKNPLPMRRPVPLPGAVMPATSSSPSGRLSRCCCSRAAARAAARSESSAAAARAAGEESAASAPSCRSEPEPEPLVPPSWCISSRVTSAWGEGSVGR